MHICKTYMHIWSLENIYIGDIYMFSIFICLFLCILHAEYMQMGANWCKCMLCCTSKSVGFYVLTVMFHEGVCSTY